MMYSAVLSQRGMVRWTKSQVSNEPNDGLHQGPTGWWLQQFDDDLDAIVLTHRILRQFRLVMARCQVTQSADRRFCNLLSIACVQNGAYQSFDATHLTNGHLRYDKIKIQL